MSETTRMKIIVYGIYMCILHVYGVYSIYFNTQLYMCVCIYVYIHTLQYTIIFVNMHTLCIHMYMLCMLSCSVVSNSLPSHGLKPTRLLCPWGFSRQEYWSGCHALLHGIFPTEGSTPGLLHCRWILY